jgi:hypothetical protein
VTGQTSAAEQATLLLLLLLLLQQLLLLLLTWQWMPPSLRLRECCREWHPLLSAEQ